MTTRTSSIPRRVGLPTTGPAQLPAHVLRALLLAWLALACSGEDDDSADPGSTAAGSSGASGSGATSSGGSPSGGASAGFGGSAAAASGGAASGAGGASGFGAAAGSGGSPPVDECDTTAECIEIYGPSATDCVDSQSDQSWCACGAAPCSGASTGGSGGSAGSGGSSGSGGSGGPTGVYIEVESIDPVAPWVEETVYSDYSGTSYFRWPDVATNANGITSSQDAVLAYDFTIGESGTYLVEVRGRRDHEGWCADAANDACNDIWVKMDSGSWTKKMIKQGTWGDWVWDGKWEPGSSVITTEIPLDVGAHTFSISGRSNGVKIDAIRIYRQGTSPPAG